MSAAEAPECPECGDALRPGERVLRVESGEQTPYGLATDDVPQRYHADCVPVAIADGGA